MSEELDRLKGALAADGYQDDVYSKVDADAVIAHLEAELKLVKDDERVAREKLAAFVSKHTDELQSRLSESLSQKKALREACEAAIRLLEDLEQSTDGFTLRLLSAALEVKK